MTSTTAVRPSVAVIVCAYTMERLEDLTDCIAALHRQSSPPDELVCVIDGNPELAAAVGRLATANAWTLQVVENTATPGLSGARNTGVGVTTGELALFIDDDAVPEPDWLEELVGPFSDPQTAATLSRSAGGAEASRNAAIFCRFSSPRPA